MYADKAIAFHLPSQLINTFASHDWHRVNQCKHSFNQTGPYCSRAAASTSVSISSPAFISVFLFVRLHPSVLAHTLTLITFPCNNTLAILPFLFSLAPFPSSTSSLLICPAPLLVPIKLRSSSLQALLPSFHLFTTLSNLLHRRNSSYRVRLCFCRLFPVNFSKFWFFSSKRLSPPLAAQFLQHIPVSHEHSPHYLIADSITIFTFRRILAAQARCLQNFAARCFSSRLLYTFLLHTHPKFSYDSLSSQSLRIFSRADVEWLSLILNLPRMFLPVSRIIFPFLHTHHHVRIR